MNSLENEKEFLDVKSVTYKINESSVHKFAIDSYMKVFSKYIEADKEALELGCSDGYSTENIARLVKKLDVVDGSKIMLSKAKENNKCSNIYYHYSLFEEFKIKKRYDYIFANYIFEHVNEPEKIINIIYNLLNEDGILFVTVPNAKSLSRQMAVNMGLLDSVYDLTENDINHGHRRVYDLESITKEFSENKFSVINKGGTFVKQFADFQLEMMIKNNIIDEGCLKAMQVMGEKYPDIAGSIYLILKKNI